MFNVFDFDFTFLGRLDPVRPSLKFDRQGLGAGTETDEEEDSEEEEGEEGKEGSEYKARARKPAPPLHARLTKIERRVLQAHAQHKEAFYRRAVYSDVPHV